MIRKSIKKSSKLSYSKSLKRSDNIYVINISLNDSFKIIDNSSPEAALLLRYSIITGITMMIMAQITVSARPEKFDYVDKLPSYKDLKKKFISSPIGRSLAALSGLAASYPWLLQDKSMQGDDSEELIIQIIRDMVDNPSPNSKRIKPSTDWQPYAKGEAGAAFGQILSCPSTNFKTINIEPDIAYLGFSDAFDALGFDKLVLDKYGISIPEISDMMKDIFLVENTGLPIDSLSYEEPNTIFSKIQNEILLDKISRTGLVNSKLTKGFEPSSPISRSLIEKFLNKKELIAYNFAISSGDKNILKKYTDIVVTRSKASS